MNRWQKVAGLSNPGLQAIYYFGQVTVENVSLAVCLLEPTDEILADVLGERILSSEETRQIAIAVADALAALHSAGLVHEHVIAANVFAAGENIKLRSDCVRECSGDFEADTSEARDALRSRDVRDLGLLLLQCLQIDGTATLPPSPLGRIIQGALDGTMNADSVVAALQAPLTTPFLVPLQVSRASEHSASLGAAQLEAGVPGNEVSEATAVARPPSLPTSSSTGGENGPVPRATLPTRDKGDAHRPGYSEALSSRRNALFSGTAAVVLLGFVFWGTTRHQHPVPGQVSPVAGEPSPKPQTAIVHPMNAKASTKAGQRSAPGALPHTGGQTGWHVIAYTYNYETQAQTKIARLKRRYISLQPQLFSPTGRAPYFVALGGPLDAASAMAIRDRARHAGLPRDTYARNF